MPDHDDIFLRYYPQKLVTEIVALKHNIDNCLHWTLLINIGVIYASILANNNSTDSKILIFGGLWTMGAIWTWMMMMRSCRSYRQLSNFNYLLKAFDYYFTNPSESTKNYIFFLIDHLAYPPKGGTKKFVNCTQAAFKYHLKQEFGVIFVIYATTFCVEFATTKDGNMLLVFLCFAMIVMWITHRTIFSGHYKKNDLLSPAEDYSTSPIESSRS